MQKQIVTGVIVGALVLSGCGKKDEANSTASNPTPISSPTLPTLNAENLPTVPEVIYYELNEVPAALARDNVKGSIIDRMLEKSSKVSEVNKSTVLYFNVDGEVKPLMCNATILKSDNESALIVGLNGDFFVSYDRLNLSVEGIEEEQHSLAYPKDGSGPFGVNDTDFSVIRDACMHGGIFAGQSSNTYYASVPEV